MLMEFGDGFGWACEVCYGVLRCVTVCEHAAKLLVESSTDAQSFLRWVFFSLEFLVELELE